MREKLLSVGSDLALDKAVDIDRSHETVQAQLKTIAGNNSGPHEQTVHAIARQPPKNAVWKVSHGKKKRNSGNISKADKDTECPKACGYCRNKTHVAKDSCCAKGKQCKKCNKWNHFAEVCHSRQGKRVHTKSEKLVAKNTDNADLFIDAVTQGSDIEDTKQAYADIEVGPNKIAVSFRLDTRASANVIPTCVFKALGLGNMTFSWRKHNSH